MNREQTTEKLRVVVTGNKGCGKSTLIKRLLSEINISSQDVSNEIGQNSQTCLTDIAEANFQSARRSYTFIDCASHKGLLRNIARGAIKTDVAILVIDASKGLLNQTCQYAYLLSMFGIQEIIIVVNKMDLKLYNRIRFWEISEEISDFLKKLNIHIVSIIPASAKYGDNITTKSSRMDWNSSATLMKSLDCFSTLKNLTQLSLRVIVQSSYLTDNKTKILTRVTSGKLFHGHQLTFGPVHHTTRVSSIEEMSGQEKTSTEPGELVALVLEDTNCVKRGQVGFNVCHPPLITDLLITEVFWIDANSLKPNDKIDILCGTNSCSGQIKRISDIYDPVCLDVKLNHVDQLAESQVANVRIKLDSPICIDPFEYLPDLGRFTIFHDNKITGGGIFK